MYETLDAPVDGGALRCGRWRGDGPTVVAAHGITANHLSWAVVAEALGGAADLVAPDLRGRGGSRDLPGPWGMARHADDVVAVLDHLGVERALIVGHSMGAFVTTVALARHPDRFTGAVLVDGGLAIPTPPGLAVDDVLHAVIGPAMQRLQMTFPSVDAYRDFWRAHPALAGWWTPAVEAYVDYDLAPPGDGGEVRSRVSIDAVRADAEDTLTRDEVRVALANLPFATTFLRAERGMLGEEGGLYPEAVAAAAAAENPRLTVETVPGVNHYTIVLDPAGAKVVAARIMKATGADRG